MYDYKNQLSTIQTLIKNGHTNEALSFTQKLTESIAVEMSAINTNHPVVNAVLNQKYRSMQEKHIAVILKVGDLQEICLEEEDIVILLSNLLDNAIRESEKVLKNTGKAVIHLKLECEDHGIIPAASQACFARQHGSVERADRFDLQRGRLFQQCLYLRAVLADDVVVVAPCLRRPRRVAVRPASPKRPKASAEKRSFSVSS